MAASKSKREVPYQLDLLVDGELNPVEAPLELPPQALAIVAHSQRKGTLTLDDCTQIRSLRGVSREQIRAYFHLLAGAGRGGVIGEGDDLTFSALPPAD